MMRPSVMIFGILNSVASRLPVLDPALGGPAGFIYIVYVRAGASHCRGAEFRRNQPSSYWKGMIDRKNGLTYADRASISMPATGWST